MKKKDLAQALGISASMVSRLSRRGMPTDCVERAKRWRKRHIEPGRIKGVRFDASAQAQSQAQLQAAVHEAVKAAQLQAGPHLRECLGLFEEAIATLQQSSMPVDLETALESLWRLLFSLVVWRCGGVEKAALHWWHWLSLIPADLAESDDVAEHLESVCIEPITLEGFQTALSPVAPISLEQLHAAFLALKA